MVRHFLVGCADDECDWRLHEAVSTRDLDANDEHWKVRATEHRDRTVDHWRRPVSVLVVDLDRPGVAVQHLVP